ncbi:MAG: ROK family glucokinase [Lachnospiraceae bacterium]|nr:ROK family glucokinase [Lachnospiraceae bacterium]
MDRKVYIGVDIGGMTVKLGIFEGEKILKQWAIPTRVKEQTIASDIAEAIKEGMKELEIPEEHILGIGIGVPGNARPDGFVYNASNIGWKDYDLGAAIKETLNIPVAVGNDANLAALAEYWVGAGKDYSSFVMITIGTGLGGGIINEGRIVNGMMGSGGEIGHIPVNPQETLRCGCGKCGCLEQYTTATAIMRMAREAIEAGELSTSIESKTPTAKDVLDAAKAGDPLAVKVMDTFADRLGQGMAIVASVMNPEAFLLGGGVSKAGDYLLNLIRPYYEKYLFKGCVGADFRIAILENDAGIIGAAKLAMDSFPAGWDEVTE